MSNTTIQTISIESLEIVTGGIRPGLSVGMELEGGISGRLGLPKSELALHGAAGGDLVIGHRIFAGKAGTAWKGSIDFGAKRL